MFESLKLLDTQAFLFLNGLHYTLLDPVMWIISDRFAWIPFYLWLLWLLYRSQRKNFWFVLLSILIMILVSDQLCNAVKLNVMRLRPSNLPELSPFIHLVNGYKGGMYGFYSAHASNSAALSVFVLMLAWEKRKYLLPVMLTFTLLLSYSRIYLGVHYPADVLAGLFSGLVIGYLGGKTYYLLVRLFGKKEALP